MKSSNRNIVITVLVIVVLAIAYIQFKAGKKDELASLIRAGDAAGVSELITSYPKLVNANLDSRTRLKPLDLAASLNQVTICSNLLAAGANVNSQDIGGATPLFFAFGGIQDSTILEMFLRHGASVTLTDIDGRSPLYVAIIAGDTNAVVTLLQHGADPTLKDRNGKTPLDHAKESVIKTNEDVIEILSEAISRMTNHQQVLIK